MKNTEYHIVHRFTGIPLFKRLSVNFSKKNVRLYVLRFSARLVMVAYTILLLKPAMPVIVDNMEHTFNAAEHFRIVHAHGGKEHVHYWMEKNARNDGHEKAGLQNHLGDEMPVHLAVHCVFEIKELALNIDEMRLFFYQRSHESPVSLPDFPPPKLG